jgi:hypothetical protein
LVGARIERVSIRNARKAYTLAVRR